MFSLSTLSVPSTPRNQQRHTGLPDQHVADKHSLSDTWDVPQVRVTDIPTCQINPDDLIAASGDPVHTRLILDHDRTYRSPTDTIGVGRSRILVAPTKHAPDTRIGAHDARALPCYPFLTWRTTDSMPVIVVDIDDPDALARLTSPLLPPPTAIMWRPSNGHAQAIWNINTVSRPEGASSMPLGSPWAYLQGMQAALTTFLGGDPAFTVHRARNPWYNPGPHLAFHNQVRQARWEAAVRNHPGQHIPQPRPIQECTDGYVTIWASQDTYRNPRTLRDLEADLAARLTAYHPAIHTIDQGLEAARALMPAARPVTDADLAARAAAIAKHPKKKSKNNDNGKAPKTAPTPLPHAAITPVTVTVDTGPDGRFHVGTRATGLFDTVRFYAYAHPDRDQIARYADQVNQLLCEPPLPASEVASTIKSIAGYVTGRKDAARRGGSSTSPAKQAAARTNQVRAAATAQYSARYNRATSLYHALTGTSPAESATNLGYANTRIPAHMAAQHAAGKTPDHLLHQVQDMVRDTIRDYRPGAFHTSHISDLWKALRDLAGHTVLPAWELIRPVLEAIGRRDAPVQDPQPLSGGPHPAPSPAGSDDEHVLAFDLLRQILPASWSQDLVGADLRKSRKTADKTNESAVLSRYGDIVDDSRWRVDPARLGDVQTTAWYAALEAVSDAYPWEQERVEAARDVSDAALWLSGHAYPVGADGAQQPGWSVPWQRNGFAPGGAPPF